MSDTTPTAEKAQVPVAVLAEHQRLLTAGGACRCGEWPNPSRDYVTWPQHLAEALGPTLCDLLAQAWDEGLAAGKIASHEFTRNPYEVAIRPERTTP